MPAWSTPCCGGSRATGKARLAALDAVPLDTPDWLMRRWIAHYGEATARAIAAAHTPASRRSTSPSRAIRRTGPATLDGRVLPTGIGAHHRDRARSRSLPGFDEGAWWVQDAAAALPARLLGDVRGKTVADLCAAPGGKTAQLAAPARTSPRSTARGARLARLRQNLARLQLDAEIVEADAAQWQGGPFDAVLLDAPCSSTGTIRRHPDIPWLKTEADLAQARRPADPAARPRGDAAQARRHAGLLHLLARARGGRGRGGGAARPQSRAAPQPDPRRTRSQAAAELLTADGDLRTLPCHLPDADPRMAGLDGFYAARIIRN